MFSKILKKLIYIGGLLPLTFLIPLLSFYFHAGIILGHFPSYNNPDPKQLAPYEFYENIISITGNIWVVSFPIWLILLIIYSIKIRKNFKSVITTAIQLLTVGILFSGILEWYAD